MRYPAPDVLKARIRASVSAADAAESAAVDPTVTPPRRQPAWMRSAAAAVLVAITSSAITALVLRSTAPADELEREVISSHIRSLMPGHLTDVASTDQHNVKPWFNGRVDLSPPVPRLDSVGFPLVGGRVDYVDGHPTATIVYTRRLHVINVFSWPTSSGDAAPATSPATHGYRIVKERRDGLALWFVSDLNAAELEDFVKRFNAASAPGP